jgi:hypothetical protein
MITFYKNHWHRIMSAFTALVLAMVVFAPGALALSDDAKDGIQQEIEFAYDKLNERINLMEHNDPKKDEAEELLDDAKDIIDEIDTDASDADFLDQEKEAREALNKVNLYLIQPFRPGAVPEGDIVEDFIPQFIRLLFRFASLAILISFVVSGIMFVVAFDNEERVTKAKQMLYYSLIGFAFVTLAFAIVKAVTDIDFFGFI